MTEPDEKLGPLPPKWSQPLSPLPFEGDIPEHILNPDWGRHELDETIYPCQPIGCDNGTHKPGCPIAAGTFEGADPVCVCGAPWEWITGRDTTGRCAAETALRETIARELEAQRQWGGLMVGADVTRLIRNGARHLTGITPIRDADMLEAAWTLIANAMGVYTIGPDGEPRRDEPVPGWDQAAARWRDDHYHPWLTRYLEQLRADQPGRTKIVADEPPSVHAQMVTRLLADVIGRPAAIFTDGWPLAEVPDGTGYEMFDTVARMKADEADRHAKASEPNWKSQVDAQLWKAFTERDPDRLRRELTQLINMLAMWVLAIDERTTAVAHAQARAIAVAAPVLGTLCPRCTLQPVGHEGDCDREEAQI